MGKKTDSADTDAEVIPIGTTPEDTKSETIPETVPGERRAAVTGHPALTSRLAPK
jgi:hypothetical protein